MATVSVINTKETNLHVSRGGNVYVPYRIEKVIKLSDISKLKGSAVAAADVVEILKIPANSAVLAAFVGVDDTIKSTTLTANVKVNGVSYVTAADLQALTLNQTSGTIVSPAPTSVINSEDKVVTLEIATLTGAKETDAIRVSFLVVDVSRSRRSDIAQLVR